MSSTGESPSWGTQGNHTGEYCTDELMGAVSHTGDSDRLVAADRPNRVEDLR